MVFKTLAVLVALYVVYALSIGRVYAKRGPTGATWTRAGEPFHYWSAIAVYSLLSAALAFVF